MKLMLLECFLLAQVVHLDVCLHVGAYVSTALSTISPCPSGALSSSHLLRRMQPQQNAWNPTPMSGQRILRRFPFALSLGTDICHVTRIRRILESSRGARFVQRILNEKERAHPKIRCLLNNGPYLGKAQAASSHDQTTDHQNSFMAANKETLGLSRVGPSLEELQLAATFMAGR